MAAISSSDVSYSADQRNIVIGDKVKEVPVSISFGDGALTYPAGGIPLDKSKMGMDMELKELLISDDSNGDGFIYKFDQSNSKIRIYQGDNDAVADGPLVELGALATPAATTLKCRAFGK